MVDSPTKDKTVVDVRISASAMRRLHQLQTAAGADEFMALLTRRKGSDVITGGVRLKSEASASHAIAGPQAIAQTLQFIRARGEEAAALGHGHGNYPVFHSGTDQNTHQNLLIALAQPNAVRPSPAVSVPAIAAQDEAVLPLVDGRLYVVRLLGRALPELGGHERGRWAGVTIRYCAESTQPEARVALEAGQVVLQGGGIVLSLGCNDTDTVTVAKVDRSAFWSATVPSIVVNRRGEVFCEVLVVHQLGARQFTELLPGRVVEVKDGEVMASEPESTQVNCLV